VRLSDEALLLRRYPYGESSLVVHVLTPRHGRVHLMAKGAYRAKSGYCGVLDWFDTLRVEWSQRPGVDLFPLSGADVLVRRELTGNLDRYRSAHYVTELAGLAARPGAREPGLYEAAVDTLDQLASPKVATPAVAAQEIVRFNLRFLRLLGLEPALETCASCGGPAPTVDSAGTRAAFSAGAGGRLCLRCAQEAKAAGKRVGTLPSRALEAAAVLLRTGTVPPELGRSGRAELQDFVERFLEYHLETKPRSLP